jgi:hypothetical protein
MMSKEIDTSLSSPEEEYMSSMLPLQYEETEEFTNYHYKSSLLKNSTGNLKVRIKRLALEHSDLSHSLPLSAVSSSIWMRASVERMDAVQFMISGIHKYSCTYKYIQKFTLINLCKQCTYIQYIDS